MNQATEEGILYELSNCEIMRLDVDDEHYYYGGEKGKEKLYFLSLTRVLDIGGPFPEGLRQYLRVTSYEEQKDRLEFTGNRGSKLHDALEQLMNKEALNLKQDYTSTYEKDAIITFIRMMRFLTPENYKNELIVADPEKRVAGTLDFEGYIEEWKLEAILNPVKYLDIDSDSDLQLKEQYFGLVEKYPHKIHLIIDWKFTGRNAYSHKVQVAAYKTMYNLSRATKKSEQVTRAFTWRYSPRHKFGFDFQESLLSYASFERIYDTTIEYLGEFPEPPMLRKYPEKVQLYQKSKVKEKV